MHCLAEHFAHLQRVYPDERLLIVFDLDGTVVDQSHAVRDVLLDYDRVHGTDHFRGLETAELEAHQLSVESVLAERGLPTGSAATWPAGISRGARSVIVEVPSTERVPTCST